ncbi:hypothetical protein ColTof4_13539 [Colletotrichum tofieldiae]|nr:hypothetical protein ColTof4_13539 [Colletotrichum tofieldiae]
MAPSKTEVPGHYQSWVDDVKRRNVEKRRLDQIGSSLKDDACANSKKKPFSGSKMPHNAFLQLRAVWPPQLDGEHAGRHLQAAGLVSERSRQTAQHLLGRRRSEGHDKFLAFLDAVCDGGSPSTPLQQSAYVKSQQHAEDRLGSFVPLLSLWKQLKPSAKKKLPLADAVVDAQTPGPQRGPQGRFNALSLVSKLDLTKCSAGFDPDGLSDLLAALDDLSIDTETPSKVLPPSDTSRSAAREPTPSTLAGPTAYSPASRPSSLPTSQPAAAGTDAGKNPGPHCAAPSVSTAPPKFPKKGRTRYEIQTSLFFGVFFHVLFAYQFSISWTNHIHVVTEETPYLFGQRPAVKPGEAPSSRAYFTACADGAFYAEEESRRLFLSFELKPYPRGEKKQSTCREETAEMAAIIWEEFVWGKQDAEALEEEHHRLMLSFNRDEFHLVLVTFRGLYISYIGNGSNTAMPLDGSQLDGRHLIEFQVLGPYSLSDRTQMRNFAEVMVALAVEQMQNNVGRSMIESLLA